MSYDETRWLGIPQCHPADAWILMKETPDPFILALKRLTGITPGAYRRKFKIPGVLTGQFKASQTIQAIARPPASAGDAHVVAAPG